MRCPRPSMPRSRCTNRGTRSAGVRAGTAGGLAFSQLFCLRRTARPSGYEQHLRADEHACRSMAGGQHRAALQPPRALTTLPSQQHVQQSHRLPAHGQTAPTELENFYEGGGYGWNEQRALDEPMGHHHERKQRVRQCTGRSCRSSLSTAKRGARLELAAREARIRPAYTGRFRRRCIMPSHRNRSV